MVSTFGLKSGKRIQFYQLMKLNWCQRSRLFFDFDQGYLGFEIRSCFTENN